MSVKLLTEHHFELLSFKGGYTGSSESTLVKMPYCWNSHAAAHMYMFASITSKKKALLLLDECATVVILITKSGG